MRPVLSSARRAMWRDEQTLQLGEAEGRAVVLAGLHPRDRAVLALLDGTRDLAGVLRDAVRAGCDADRAGELVALLQRAGALVDARDRWPPRMTVAERDRLAGDVASLGLLHDGAGLTVLRRRDEAAVVVVGAARIGAPLAGLLACAGVGTVDVVDDGVARPQDTGVGGLQPEDVGRRRADAARERLRALAPSTSSGPVARPSLVVLTAPQRDDRTGRALLDSGVPHLRVAVHEAVGVVGPLVLPGTSACLHCLDLERSDRDPDWPALLAQQVVAPQSAGACDGTLVAAVAAQAALQVLALLDGSTPAAVGGSLELALPDWRWRRRTWERHPACSCRWPAAG